MTAEETAGSAPPATRQTPLVSYAQNHEDVVLARALRPREREGFWIDVGAGDPVGDSVTALFSELGWRGINIEPLPDEFARLCEQRPHDINLQVAVADAPGVGQLYAGPPENRGMSTLDAIRGEQYLSEGFTTLEVPITTVAEIVEEHVAGPVDFLKIDVEGFERAVLAGTDFERLHPTIVVIEATQPGTSTPTHQEWESILLAAGYRCTLFDGLNRFYVAADAPDEVAHALSFPANVLDDYVPFIFHRQVELAIDERDSAIEQLDLVSAARERELADSRKAQKVLSDLQAELEELHRVAGDLHQQLQQREARIRMAQDQLEIERERLRSALDDLDASQRRCADALEVAASREDAADYARHLEGELHAIRERLGYRFMDSMAVRVRRSPVIYRVTRIGLRLSTRRRGG